MHWRNQQNVGDYTCHLTLQRLKAYNYDNPLFPRSTPTENLPLTFRLVVPQKR